MIDSTMIVLYVDDITASTEFYARLLAQEAVESTSHFTLFIRPTGAKIALWSKQAVQPAAGGLPGCCELALAVPDAAAVDTLYRRLSATGVEIEQRPSRLEFGYTFTARDPDGHRLRIYHRAHR